MKYYFIPGIVVYDAIPGQYADELYDYLVDTLPYSGYSDDRGCAANPE